jgi:hypothetical protein
MSARLGKRNVTILSQLSGEEQGRLNVFPREVLPAHDRLEWLTDGDVRQDDRYKHPRSLDARLAMTHIRVHTDPVSPLH